MSATAITQLVSFLTRPLMRSHTPATIISLQICLQTALLASPESTLFLSASCPPPAPIQRACLLTGVRWADWISLLSGGVDVQVFLTEALLAVKVGTLPRRTLWFTASVAAPIKSTALALMLVSSAMPFKHRLRAAAALTSTRARCGAALNPTRIPTLLSSSWEDETDAESDMYDSDSDSDSESSDSESGYSFTSASSATSISTPTSPTALPFRRAPSAKSEPAQYTYEGGVTRVMSGGVMLGSVPAPISTSRRTAPSWRKTAAV
ncbi:hypothetical protein C8R46DRAFT_1192253 [Mycena filopes]|nr:hypothetical protein C8R46DRAFT_1192253 [Mycena filopes]